MISILGNFTLALSCGLAVLLMLLPVGGIVFNNEAMQRNTRHVVYALFSFILLAGLILVYALLKNDFSIAYVAQHSNSQLPYYYQIAAAWGAHEGSLLLWSLLLAGWTLFIARPHPEVEEKATLYVLAVMGFVNAGFLFFITFTSNPFDTLLIAPIEGADLNPLLQDIGLIFHPPLLYMGYVGFSVAFAFAIAALLMGRFDTQWIRWFRPWVIVAWIFLSIGILLGSIWAYRELGWGGWWFWDPVENSSLMPWIVGTALLHSVLVAKNRGTFKIWTLLLAITTFSLCLIGTFLVRSGILVSVHAFSSDPSRGIYILLFLIFVIGGSFLLFALRGHKIINKDQYNGLFSKDSFMTAGNTLLLTAMLIVFLGTLFPLFHKQLGLGSISVGEPFFNSMFYWLMIPFGLFMGIAPLLKWQQDTIKRHLKSLYSIVILSIVIASLAAITLSYTQSIPEQQRQLEQKQVVLEQRQQQLDAFKSSLTEEQFQKQQADLKFDQAQLKNKQYNLDPKTGEQLSTPTLILKYINWYNFLSLLIASWIILFTLFGLLKRLLKGKEIRGINASHWGMVTAHLGIAMMIIGTSVSNYYKLERQDLMRLDQTLNVGAYSFTFKSLEHFEGPNYQGDRGTFEVTRNGKQVVTLRPEKREYAAQAGMPMTEVAIDSTVARDLYVALSERQENGSWAVRLYYKPLIFWIWFGGFCIIIGGIIAVLDKRMRLSSRREESDETLTPLQTAKAT